MDGLWIGRLFGVIFAVLLFAIGITAIMCFDSYFTGYCDYSRGANIADPKGAMAINQYWWIRGYQDAEAEVKK